MATFGRYTYGIEEAEAQLVLNPAQVCALDVDRAFLLYNSKQGVLGSLQDVEKAWQMKGARENVRPITTTPYSRSMSQI